ncbi:MAG: hypothetical protein G8345_16720 [Magnetococcales bacterium]|nr:hypothetical protein [Magnetococcales bacterium]
MEHIGEHTSPPPPRPIVKRNKRQRTYVDFAIQMRMLIALVVMELVLVASGVAYLYYRFNAIVEENLYRIHQTNTQSPMEILLAEAGWVVAALVAANLVALLVADRIWYIYVRRVLERFMEMARKMRDFDLREESSRKINHEVLVRMLAWHMAERKRALNVRAAIQNLHPDADFKNPVVKREFVRNLQWLRRVLPPYSRRFVGRLENHDSQ